ncbi:tetratricopeptide repeat protein [Burkholderia catarinensis]|uniref:tetratricopeptide repeat protein n=1 Tax=Burkholderia catarinensis TaxID=1108140 RepID=UPI00100820AB|nr:tetratricopeptide repeat protein [Burkholderia catarinensis]KAG8148556.1 hypothetical protein BFF94_037240 [Burkholderia catarinensis]
MTEPTDDVPHGDLGSSLIDDGRYEEAYRWYTKCLEVTPHDPMSISGAAVSLWFLGQRQAGIHLLCHAVAADPVDPNLANNLGWLLIREGDYNLAHERLSAALGRHPDHPALRVNLGLSLLHLGRNDEAIKCLTPLLASGHSAQKPLELLGLAYHRSGRFDEAVACFEQLIRAGVRDVDVLFAYCDALARVGRFEDSLGCCARILSKEPGHIGALINKVRVLGALGRASEGLATLVTARRFHSTIPDDLPLRSLLLAELGRIEEALEVCMQAVRLNDSPELRCQLGRLQLTLGKYESGFASLEARRKLSSFIPFTPNSSALSWAGDFSLAHKTLFVYQEEGHGDMIQYLRYLPFLVSQARHVVVAVPESLAAFAQTAVSGATVITAGYPIPHYDCYIPFMSLPYALGTTLDTVPRNVPYLSAEKTRVDLWKNRLQPLPRQRIGIVWAGQARHARARSRDIPISELQPFRKLQVSLIGLQRPVRVSDSVPVLEMPNFRAYGDQLEDFMDVAALMTQLDLVITVDTAYAHVAGALGLPVWILLDSNADWRWGRERNDSHWYPTARLFRQENSGDWSKVIASVMIALREYMPMERKLY